MICDKYRVNDKENIEYYLPILDKTTGYNNGKDIEDLWFKVPALLNINYATPLLYEGNESFNNLPISSKMKGITFVQRFINQLRNIYPQVIYVKVEDDKYVKFKFWNFCSADFQKTPFITYSPMNVVRKDQIPECVICVEE